MVQKLAQKKNVTPSQISLAWMLKKYPNLVPIPGSKNKGRIKENFDAHKVVLTDEEFTEFENELKKLKVYDHRGLNH